MQGQLQNGTIDAQANSDGDLAHHNLFDSTGSLAQGVSKQFQAALYELTDVHSREVQSLLEQVEQMKNLLEACVSSGGTPGGTHGLEPIDEFDEHAAVYNRDPRLGDQVMNLQTANPLNNGIMHYKVKPPAYDLIDIDEPDLKDFTMQVATEVAATAWDGVELNGDHYSKAVVPNDLSHTRLIGKTTDGAFGPKVSSSSATYSPYLAPEASSEQTQGVPSPVAANKPSRRLLATEIRTERLSQTSLHSNPRNSNLSMDRMTVMTDSDRQARRSTEMSSKAHLSGSRRRTLVNTSKGRVTKIRSSVKEMEEIEQYRSNAEKRAASQSNQRRQTKRKVRREVKNKLQEAVFHPSFDIMCACMIILNSIYIGWTVDYLTTRDEQTTSMKAAGYFCSFFFFMELVARVSAQGWDYFTDEGRWWNYFDTLLVIQSIVDILLTEVFFRDEEQAAGNVTSGLKTIKMLRIVRIVRVFRFFKDLAMLAFMILDSLKALVWALVMLLMIIYVFSIVFTDVASTYLKQFKGDPILHNHMYSEVERLYGSVFRSIYTLFQSMLGGLSWGVATDALMECGVFYLVLFCFYIAFTMLAVLNIITGVFVEEAMETARTQRDFLVTKEMELREKYVAEIGQIFDEMDDDESGTVTMEEIMSYFEDARVQSYFVALGLDHNDMDRLFTLLDDDGSGEVSADEFLEGCLRLKGMARSIDVHVVLHELKRFAVHLEDSFAEIKADIDVVRSTVNNRTVPTISQYGKQSTYQLLHSPLRGTLAYQGLNSLQSDWTRGSCYQTEQVQI